MASLRCDVRIVVRAGMRPLRIKTSRADSTDGESINLLVSIWVPSLGVNPPLVSLLDCPEDAIECTDSSPHVRGLALRLDRIALS